VPGRSQLYREDDRERHRPPTQWKDIGWTALIGVNDLIGAPDPDSESTMLPVIEDLVGDEAIRERIVRYQGAMAVAAERC